MRVLLWCEQYRPDIGGAEVWTAELAGALRGRGHEVMAVACNGPKSPEAQACFEGVAVYRFPFHTALLRRDLKTIMQMSREVGTLKRELAPDLIHINTCRPSLLYHERTVAAWPCPTLVTVHEPPIAASGGNSLLERVLAQADWVCGVSNAMLEDARSLAPSIAPRSSVVYNAMRETDRMPIPVADDAPFLCVGRLVHDKGIDLAIRAMAALERQDVALTIVGDGEARPSLEALATELGVAQQVSFAGWVDPGAIHAWYDRSRAVIIPSRWREPFGLVVLEAAEAARPVIAARAGGLSEIVEEDVTGLRFDVDDVAGLTRAMARLLADPERAAAMGTTARAVKRDRFSYARLVDQYEALYARLVAGTSGVAAQP